MIKNHQKPVIFIIFALTLLMGLGCIGIGNYNISLYETIRALQTWGSGVSDTAATVILGIRLPRVILSIIAGAGLACAGAAFQSLFSNPLATPDTLGVANGASFGAVLALLLHLSTIMVQISAMIFGLLAVFFVLLISKRRGSRSIIMMILAGLVISSFFQALISIVKLMADPQDQLPAITFWLMGSLSGTMAGTLLYGLPLLTLGIIIIFILRWRLNALSLHEDEAKSLGINVGRMRNLTILGSTMITASVVSMCGQIGWVGLLVPHIARMLFGNNNKFVIPGSIVMGGMFFLLIDTLARNLTASELPVSILTALIGAPLFIYLLRKSGGIK